ncbi:MAG: hypothetical protein KAQ92_03185 [Candidatus Aenigmarchaeota archaeon]|nr:hypothetical protein [Candidatus Aenigmarchaeota archaeon]
MALGWSGSNGGVQEICSNFVLTDVNAVIVKYESLYKSVPERQTKTREIYQRAIKGLTELQKKMIEGLEGKA